jgi:hypothetical protein
LPVSCSPGISRYSAQMRCSIGSVRLMEDCDREVTCVLPAVRFAPCRRPACPEATRGRSDGTHEVSCDETPKLRVGCSRSTWFSILVLRWGVVSTMADRMRAKLRRQAVAVGRLTNDRQFAPDCRTQETTHATGP